MAPHPVLRVLGMAWLAVWLIAAAPSVHADDAPPAPLSPEEALRAFRLSPDLEVELVASEPLIVDPVAFDFAPDGRLWVCEMHDYPLGLDGNYKPGGRIKVLEDTDGDGQYDKATLFLEGVAFPTGVTVWGRGALICTAPQVIYAEDTDGDGKADRQEVVCEGFGTGNYQSRVNSLYLGLDNWLYGASGLYGQQLTMRVSGDVVDVGSRDFRMTRDLKLLEPASGRTQYGRTRDDWDNHFGNTNSSLLQHYPLPDHYAARNPHVAPPAPYVFVPRGADNDRVYPASQTLARYNDVHAANRVTSACSPAIYRDRLLGEQYNGDAFMCEPVHNLVTRLKLTPEGVTFAGHRAEGEQSSEFLASTDNWFRPSQVKTGPDGALYVADMYRYVIEHPRWISPGMLARLDVRAGSDKGRIYRIVRKGTDPRPLPDFTALSTTELAAALESPNGPRRDIVQRLLLERDDPAAAATLAELAKSSERPEVRAQALCTLDGLGVLDADPLLAALDDPHPGVRRQVARLAETRLGADPRFGPALVELAEDPEETVRFQAALSLGSWDDPRAGSALGRIAMADPADRWVAAAVLSAAMHQPAEILAAVLETAGEQGFDPPTALVSPLVATTAAVGDSEALAAVAATLTDVDGPLATWRLTALADLLGSRKVASDEAFQKSLAERIAPALDAARAMAVDESAREQDRVATIEILGRTRGDEVRDTEMLASLIDPRQPASVASAAVRALDRRGGGESAGSLLARWPELGPEVRGAVLDALLARREGMVVLLEGLQDGAVRFGDLSANARQRLTTSEDEAVRALVAEVFSEARPEPRSEVLATYTESLQGVEGDLQRGAAVFEKHCATCHALAGKGNQVGPDLAQLTDRSREALLIALLDPNREVDGRYVAYNAALADGRVLNGLIASESGNALTLVGPDGQEQVVLRSELEELRSTGQSLMPDGLEADIPPADMADLIAHVATGGVVAKTFAGNEPRVIEQAEDGTIRLPATAAEIYGDTLVFEPEHENLGYWQSPNDRASWTFVVDRPGIYNVSMEWACPDDHAGGAFLVQVDGNRRRNLVSTTGGWSNYDAIFIDEKVLEPGTHRLELLPDGAPERALFDIKAVVISPIR